MFSSQRTVLIFTFFLLTGNSQGLSGHDLEMFNWLEGTWERKTKSGSLYEKWTRVSNRTLEGDNYVNKDGKVKYVEFLRLERYGEQIFYIPKVAHNKYPVPFLLIDTSQNRFVFENSEHDFPQRIIYHVPHGDSLHVRIEGDVNGKGEAADFYFQKIE